MWALPRIHGRIKNRPHYCRKSEESVIGQRDISKAVALKFIILLGLTSLFADMTYEAARSITGPFLATLGASAAIVGFVAGFGEFLGYSIRLVSGYLADKTQRYWMITIVGYAINMAAVPALALAESWYVASILIILERTGKAIRTPARDAMLSHAGSQIGVGWAFGLHEALDQWGAMIGPLIVAAVLYYKGSYQEGFALLVVPALLALIVLIIAFKLYPHPHHLEIKLKGLESKGMTLPFWIYLVGAGLIAAGYADFSLIAYHFEKKSIFSPVWIPLVYSLAMGMITISAPLLGYLYDKKGFRVLILVSILSILFAPFVFLGGFYLVLVGIALWSIGIGAHESLMRAIIANMISSKKRASAYGIFNAGFGTFWFLGSVMIGVLYDFSVLAVVIFSVIIQLLAVPILVWVKRRIEG
ncbi:MAG: MFS transporter [Alphaproteobacteria bacterium]|nr:MFS transporter [Alphaproteobacteria bacterium]